MPTSSRDELIAAIHACDAKAVLAATGGGATAISDLLAVPGASNTVLEAVVPYASKSLAQWLGAEPEHACDERTARLMAMRAFRRALELLGDEADAALACGVACTAALASNRPKRGEHRAHIAIQTSGWTAVESITLAKGERTRLEEERLVADSLLNAVAWAFDVEQYVEIQSSTEDRKSLRKKIAPTAWTDLLLRKREAVCCVNYEPCDDIQPHDVRVLFPGSFRPMHDGHRRLIEWAERVLKAPVDLELAIDNVDKPPLDFLEIADRLFRIGPDRRVWLTNSPTFESKSAVFPDATFLVGADTIRRIGDASYYGGEMDKRIAAIQRIAERGCRFLVFGRLQSGRADGPFETLDDVELPDVLRAICQGIPEREFREDISSTELRRGR